MQASRMRVEQLAAKADLSVDTIRYYQARGLLASPRREGRVAWYGTEHLQQLARIRELAARGLTLATIGRLFRGELDSADEALAVAVSSASKAPSRRRGAPVAPAGGSFDVSELSRRSGIPVAMLEAVIREGFLVGESHDGEARYTDADVLVAAAGLKLLEAGLPLPEVMELARRHHAAMREIAEQAVALFDDHVRQPLRASGYDQEEAAQRLVDAFQSLLPATMTIVSHHFRRTLLSVALEHIERVGDAPELQAVQTERFRLGRGA